MERVWPLDNRDYLTVCDNHPTPYYSNAARLADQGDREDIIVVPDTDRHRGRANGAYDYLIVASSPSLLRWRSLRELSSEMNCNDGEVASLAHHLASAVRRGLLQRIQKPRTVNGVKRMLFFYKVAK